MPIHLRAEPGDYAEACLLPGDPLRANYIAETYFTDVKQVNGERGLLGGCLLLVSDMVIDGTFSRIGDEEMRAAVDRTTRIALAVAIGAHSPAVKVPELS